MSDLLDVPQFADDLAERLTGILPDGVRATTDARGLVPPALLVMPIPALTFDMLDQGFTASWSLVALAAGGGDLAAARSLLRIVRAVSEELAVEQARPITYYLPSRPDQPFPAYRLDYTTTHTPD